MNRRRFLGLFGIGALGGTLGTVAGSDVVRSRRPPPAPEQEDEEVQRPDSGVQRVIWSVDTDEPAAALTFDDGPDPEFTPRILHVLDRYRARATFMVMGYNAMQHPHLLRDIRAAGHEIGSHGWSHLNLRKTTATETRNEIEAGIRTVEEVAELPVRVFRPPYGRFSETAVNLLAPSRRDLVVWSVTRGDLTWQDPAKVASHVVGSLGPGEIVDLHDGIGRGTFNRRTEYAKRLRERRAVELEALPRILEGVRAKGLRLETVSDLIAG